MPVEPQSIDPTGIHYSSIVMLVSPEHEENASWPIINTELGILILVISLQPENAKLPILLTEYVVPLNVRYEGMITAPLYDGSP